MNAVSKPDDLPSWDLESARSHFDEVLRRAQMAGPQRVGTPGHGEVVVVSSEDYARMTAAPASRSLLDLLSAGPFADSDDIDTYIVRERGIMREPPDFGA